MFFGFLRPLTVEKRQELVLCIDGFVELYSVRAHLDIKLAGLVDAYLSLAKGSARRIGKCRLSPAPMVYLRIEPPVAHEDSLIDARPLGHATGSPTIPRFVGRGQPPHLDTPCALDAVLKGLARAACPSLLYSSFPL